MEEKNQNQEINDPGSPFDESELELMEKLAGKVVRWGMGVPAILFLESSKPFNFIASQMMHFFNPFVSVFLDSDKYDKFAGILEKRESVEEIVRTIERKEAERKREEQQK